MEATAAMTIRIHLAAGQTVALTPADCAQILNAMARRRMLTVSVENIPDDLAHLYSEEVCAWAAHEDCAEPMDDSVVLSVDASNYSCGIEREAPKKAKKKAAR